MEENKVAYWILMFIFGTLAYMAYHQKVNIFLSKTISQISIIIGGLCSMYVAIVDWKMPIVMAVLGCLAFSAVFCVEGIENTLAKTKQELKDKQSNISTPEFGGIHLMKKKKSKFDSENIQVTYLEDDM
jgi:uncharacterized membrane protein